MGAFKKQDALALVARGKPPFGRQDEAWLWQAASGHPFLLQAAAATLWDLYADGEPQAALRFEQAGKEFYRQAAPVLQDAWRLWTPEMKKAFTIVSLDNVPLLLGRKREYDLTALLETLPDFAPELRLLETRGYLRPDPALPGGWGIQAEAMLWVLADELLHALREGDALGAWLRAEGWEGLLKRGEKEALLKAGKKVADFLKDGTQTFIRAAAEGWGRAATSR